jgi:hypothetical protein
MKLQDEIDKALHGRRRGGRIRVSKKEDRTADGIVFHSKYEMNDYLKFKSMLKGGAIKKYERQVHYPLFGAQPRCGGDEFSNQNEYFAVQVSEYVADHVVTELDGTLRVYDSKGHQTAEYKRSKKWFEVCYPHLRIVEI